MFEKTTQRFNDKKAFTNFGVSITFNQINSYTNNLAAFLQNKLNLIS